MSLFVPGVAPFNRLALAWGVVATYLIATAVLTSWPRRLFSRRTWRIVHLGSVVGVALAFVHAYQMGTEASGRAFRIGLLLLVAVGSYTLFIRLIGVVANRRAATRTLDIHSWHTARLHLDPIWVGLDGPMESPTLGPASARCRRPTRQTTAAFRARRGPATAASTDPTEACSHPPNVTR